MSQPGIREGLKLLNRPDFAKLFVAYLISYFGTAMAPIAIAFGVLDLTGSTKDSAIVIAAPTTAQIVVILIGGTLADRSSRKHMLVIADSLAMTSQIVIAYLFISGNATVPLLTILMFITGSAYALHAPAATGFIPQIVPREDLQAANALLGAARNSSFTLGAAMAGILVATIGAGMTIAIDGISFGISALLIASLRPRQQAAPEEASFIEDLRLGWQEFITHKWLWTIVLQFSLVVAALDAVFGLLGPAVTKLQMNGAVDWGIISAGLGLGTLTGGILVLKLQVRRPMLFATICVFLFSLLPLALAVPLSLAAITAMAFLGGVAGEIFGVLWYTTLQKKIPPHLLSRVSAYDHLGSICLAPLGIVVAGFLFEFLGSRETLLIAAATVVIPTLCVLCVREVRELTTDEVNQSHRETRTA
tara:strand:- start:15549 stop:16805 length:1257 start_codon:yes stop_codon:yes gene_type:complete